MSKTMSEKTIIQVAEEADLLLKAGQINRASKLIHSLNFSKLPRRHHQAFAKLCRRSGLIHQGLRLMYPVMRLGFNTIEAPTDNEICEYSSLLSRNGSISEAIALLEKIDATRTPEASLYLGQCHISNWDYEKAAEYFRLFLAFDSDPYLKLVAQVNLASSYIVLSKLTEAADLLETVQPLAESIGATRLVGNCHELWGQIHFWQGDFVQARASLQKALQIFHHTKCPDQLLIQKTEAILSTMENKSVLPLRQFRQEALLRKQWESVREADLFQLVVEFDQRKMDHLVHGTPKMPYRNRVQQILGARPSDLYVLGVENNKILDIKTGTIDGEVSFPRGKRIHQVLASLLRDFYVPRNVGALFSELYPGEWFDAETSPPRVRQLMMRTRQWLQENQIPISIVQNEGAYRLLVQEGFGIQISLETPSIDPMLIKWNELKAAFDRSPGFSADQVCLTLGWSRTSFRRLVDWALQSSLLQKSGVGRSTLYHFCPQSFSSQFVTNQNS